ncbi:MAG: NAD(P)H-dependent glycerol-3-phosphate dehydrogenase [Rickettsiales bacterium]|jgi:glycerol-3-phosphate dehydrogenase (NAD(P)+)|nr:NAD(P)H-dependent glycerol-3-phosphate dehydrogenase [Rickettsiales bacterium]
MINKVTILGAGAFGSAVANIVSEKDYDTKMFSIEEECVNEINSRHTNSKYVKDGVLNANVSASLDIAEAVEGTGVIFIVLPSKVTARVIYDLNRSGAKNFARKFVLLTKGIDEVSGKFFSDLISEQFPDADVAVMSGPNFAEELFAKKPTITTMATKNMKFFGELENILNCNFLKLQYFGDLRAVQLCGLVKNVVAVVCGISEGLDLGKNIFAALITRGIDEMRSFCRKFNCDENVVMTPAGVGDLVLTCSSLKSRNMSFGHKIGGGMAVEELLGDSAVTVEGVSNAKSLSNMSDRVAINDSFSSFLLEIISNSFTKRQLEEKITRIGLMV